MNTCDISPDDFRYLHRVQILTADLSTRAYLLPKLCALYQTLYPTVALRIVGGYYGEPINNPSVVRILSDRCCLCSFTSSNCIDLQLHMHLMHGCLPGWYLANLKIGLKVLKDIMSQLPGQNLPDQTIIELLQVVYLRVQCHLGLHDDHRGQGIPGNGRHLGPCGAKRPIEETPWTVNILREKNVTKDHSEVENLVSIHHLCSHKPSRQTCTQWPFQDSNSAKKRTLQAFELLDTPGYISKKKFKQMLLRVEMELLTSNRHKAGRPYQAPG